MANEIQATYDPNTTLYALIFNAAGQVWRNNAPQQFLAYAPGAIGVYDIPLSEIATNSGQYRADWPDHANMIVGDYSVVLFEQAGGGPASTDERIGETGIMYWDGVAEVTQNMLDTVLDTIEQLVNNPYTWYVTKAGNDGNGGAAWGDAFLTIAAAVAAASNGDKILVGSGTYDEQIDILTAAIRITLEGVDKNLVILTYSAATPTLDLYDNCVVRRMSIVSTHASGKAINANLRIGVTVEDCIIDGIYDGIVATSSVNLILRRCKISGTYDGASFSGADFLLVEDCTFNTDGSYTAVPARAVVIFNASSRCVFRRCLFEARRSDTQLQNIYAFRGSGRLLLENCMLVAEISNAVSNGNVTGINEATAVGSNIISLISCKIVTVSAGGGTVKDIVQNSGIVRVTNTLYDATKTTGTILDISTEARLNKLDATVSSRSSHTASDVTGGMTVASAETNIRGADSDTLKTLSDNQTTILSRIGAFTTGGVNNILGFFKAICSKVATAPSDIGGTFDPAADSTEAIRDRGDAAWLTSGSVGASTKKITISDGDGNPMDGVTVWISTDIAGSNVVRDGTTNASGEWTFRHDFAAGTVVYVWAQKSGYNFVNPTERMI